MAPQVIAERVLNVRKKGLRVGKHGPHEPITANGWMLASCGALGGSLGWESNIDVSRALRHLWQPSQHPWWGGCDAAGPCKQVASRIDGAVFTALSVGTEEKIVRVSLWLDSFSTVALLGCMCGFTLREQRTPNEATMKRSS